MGFPWQVYKGNPNGNSQHRSFQLQTNHPTVVKMMDILIVAIFAFLLNLIIMWIMDLFSRSTESQTRLSAVNPNKIEPNVNYATTPAINDEFSTTSGEDLNNQSFLRLMAEEKNLIVLENESLVNELSLVQSQLTDSHSKLRQYQNVHIQLANTKSELEEKKSLITDITEKNLHLINENSGLKRKIEDRARLIASSQAELQEFRTSFDEQQLDTRDLAVATRELESKNRTISELQTENLRLAENNKRLRRRMEDADRLLVSSQSALQQLREQLQELLINDSHLRRDTGRLLLSSKVAIEELQLSLNKQTERVEQLLGQMRTLDQEKDEAVWKLTEMQQQMKTKIREDVGCGSDKVILPLRMEEPITPATTELTQIVTSFLASGFTAQANSPIIITAEAQPVNSSESFPSVFHHHQIEESIRPSDEITDIVAAFFATDFTTSQAKSPVTVQQAHQLLTTDALKNSPARTVIVEKKAVEVSTKQPPAALPDFSITSKVEKEIYVDKIVITGISNYDCGRVVGRHGSNAKRIQEEYYVRVSFINGKLFITEGDPQSRLAACSDVIDNLPVTIECPNLDLKRNTFSKKLRELAFDHSVRINPPSLENKYVTIWGRLDNCRKVFKILKFGSR